MTYKEVFQLAQEKGYVFKAGKPQNEGQFFDSDINYFELVLVQRWLREEHLIFLHVEHESIGSDEWVFVYKIAYLPKDHWSAKRRMPHFIYKDSFSFSGGATYSGGWDKYEQALLAGVGTALKLLP